MKKKFLFLSLLIVAMTVGAVGAWASQTKTGQRSSVEAMASPESATNTETSSNGSRPLKSMYTFLNVTHFFENAGFDDDLTFQADGSMQTAASTETSISGQSWAYIAPDGTVYARPKASSPKSRSDGRKMDAVNGFWGQMAGWELTTTATYPNCEWSYYGAIPYSLGATAVPIGDDSDQFLIVPEKPEALNTDDNTGVLMLSAGWGGSATYSQTVYLPAGLSVTVDYWLKATNEKETQYGEVTCRLINNGKVICSKTGYTYEWQHYKMSGVDGSGPTTIEFSFKAGNAGSNSNPIIWIDGLHVEKNIIYNPSEHKEIHVSPSNNKYGKVAGNRTILQGMDTIVKAIPNVGYQFMNWTSNGEVVSTEREFKFTVSRDTTLVANFVPDAQEQYTMTFVLDNGEENVVLIQDAGTELTPPTPTRTGYTFVGWEPAVPTTVPEEDRTFIAQWKELRKVWNFRNGFSQETVDALRTDFEQYGANTYWRNYEIEASNADDQHFWCASQEAKNEDGFAATHNGGNEKVIAELDGLKLGFTAPKKFVITYNGTTIPNELESEGGPALGEPIPHGTSYIWLNGKNETITFQAMVNQKIRIGVESHSVDATKLGEARGITLSASKGTLTAHFEGNPVTTYYTEYEWELTGEEGTVSDLTIKSTSGCHIYFIAVGEISTTFVLGNGQDNVVLLQDAGTELTPPTPTRTGYTFAGWSPAVPATVPEEDMTFTAQWTVVDYSISYDLGGGSWPEGSAHPASYNIESEAITLGTPTRTGYTFTGWTGTELTEASQTVTIAKGSTGNRSYTANWVVTVVPQYTMTFVLGNGEENVVMTQDTGTELTAPTPTRTGYTFAGWEPAVPATVPEEDMTFTAQWTVVDYSISYDLGGGSWPEGSAHPASYNIESEAITLGTPTRTGYTFTGWTGTELTEASQTVTIAKGSTGNRSYTANWVVTVVPQYTMTFVLGNGEENVVMTQDTGTELTAPTPTRTGYTFAGWEPAVPATVPEEDMTFTAQWTVVDYSISYDLGGGSWPEGSAHPASYNIESEAITLGTPTRTGYTFTGWTGTELTEASQTVTIAKGSTGNRSYTATWEAIPEPSIDEFSLNNGTLVNLVDALKGKSAKVSYTRNFSNGVASTICLPYTMTNIEGGKVYSLRNVAYDYTAAAWVATMDDTTPDGNLIATTEAGMPYLFVPETDGNVTFTGIVPTVPDSYAAFSLVNATSNGWVMTGTYEQLDWTESMGAIFGFAANAENDVRAGEFVRATTGAYIPAYRAYLRYTGSNEALQSRAFKVQNANDPQRVIVRLVSKGGETTDIATMKVDMLNDKWYTLDGRMVNGQPTKKGLYILNGKKVRVK